MRHPYRPLSTLLAILFASAEAFATPKTTVTYGSWSAALDRDSAEVLLICDGTVLASAGAYPAPKILAAEPTAAGLALQAEQSGRKIGIEYTFTDGKLHCRYQAQEKGGGFNLMITFKGGDLAGSPVEMDGQSVNIPRQPDKHEFRHARNFVFFPDQAARKLGLEIPVCNFANLRDFRGQGGRTDLQLFAFADQTGALELVFDLTLAQAPAVANRYAGQEYVIRDDLHLPDLGLSKNLVQNPGFEGGLSLWGWGVTDIKRAPVAEHGWAEDETGGRSGKRSARYLAVKGYNAPMLCSFPIAVKSGRKYTASFYAKTDQPGAGFSLFVQTALWGAFPGKTRVKLETEWKRYTLTFEAPNPFFRLCFGELWWEDKNQDQLDGAHLWLDDVQLEEGEAATDYVQKPLYCFSRTPEVDNGFALDAPEKPVEVTLVNTSAEARNCTLKVSLQDCYRNALKEETFTAELPAGESLVKTLNLASLPTRGLVRIVMTATSGDLQETFYGRALVFEPIVDSGRVVYGYHLPQPERSADGRTPMEERLRRLQSYGIWGSLSFQPTESPDTVAKLQALNWTHIFTAAHDRKCPVKVFHQAMNPEDWQTYDTWLGERIRQYPGQLLWKTLNEPNCGGYDWTPADCVRAVELIRRHVKAGNPQAQILTPDPYNASRGGRSWLEEYFQAGGDKLTDVVAIHTYRARPEEPDLDYDIQELIALKAKYGLATAPIMFTEGPGQAPYTIPEINMSAMGGFFEWRLDLLALDAGRSELAAAAIMARTMLACLKNNTAVKFYLTWRWDVSQGQPMASLGAINWLYARLRDADFVQEHLIGEETKTYVFLTPERRPVAVMWNHDLKVDRGQDAAPEAALDLPENGWRAYDLMGNPLEVGRKDGRAVFALSGWPVYIVGEGLSLDELNLALEKSTVGGRGAKVVDLTLRLTGAAQAVLQVKNRILSPVAGTAKVTAADRPEVTAELNLAPRAEAPVEFALPPAGPAFNPTPIRASFTAAGQSGAVEKRDELRWFAIPRLKKPMRIDGDPADWSTVPELTLNTKEAVKSWGGPKSPVSPWGGPDDLSATYRFGYREDGLYFCIAVRDEVFNQTNLLKDAWKGDSLQLYFDLLADGHDRAGLGFDANDESLCIALTDGQAGVWRDYTPMNEIAFVKSGRVEAECAIKHANGTTIYEVKLPLKEIFPLKMQPGTSFGFGLLVNDADADGRRKQSLSNTAPGTEPHCQPELWPLAILTE